MYTQNVVSHLSDIFATNDYTYLENAFKFVVITLKKCLNMISTYI